MHVACPNPLSCCIIYFLALSSLYFLALSSLHSYENVFTLALLVYYIHSRYVSKWACSYRVREL